VTPESATSLQAKRDASRRTTGTHFRRASAAARRHHLTSTDAVPSLRAK
jgi:hypothetical protein